MIGLNQHQMLLLLNDRALGQQMTSHRPPLAHVHFGGVPFNYLMMPLQIGRQLSIPMREERRLNERSHHVYPKRVSSLDHLSQKNSKHSIKNAHHFFLFVCSHSKYISLFLLNKRRRRKNKHLNPNEISTNTSAEYKQERERIYIMYRFNHIKSDFCFWSRIRMKKGIA